MIRQNKPVKLLEWGEGTNTNNQIWMEIAKGKIVSAKTKNGLTTLVINCEGAFNKKNPKNDAIKIVQAGEGMSARSDSWGEVATGTLKETNASSNKITVSIEIPTAVKISK